VFDIANEKWDNAAVMMKSERAIFGLHVHNDKLTAFGGYNSKDYYDFIDNYDDYNLYTDSIEVFSDYSWDYIDDTLEEDFDYNTVSAQVKCPAIPE